MVCYIPCKIGYYISLGIKSDTSIKTFYINHIQEWENKAWQLSCPSDMIQHQISKNYESWIFQIVFDEKTTRRFVQIVKIQIHGLEIGC